jgi:hypothetical protein
LLVVMLLVVMLLVVMLLVSYVVSSYVASSYVASSYVASSYEHKKKLEKFEGKLDYILQGSSLSESKNVGYYQQLPWIVNTYTKFVFLLQVLLHMLCYFSLQIFIIFSNKIYYGNLLLRSLYKLSFLSQNVNICIKLDLLFNAVITSIKSVFLMKIIVAYRIQFIKTLSLSRNLQAVEVIHILSEIFL